MFKLKYKSADFLKIEAKFKADIKDILNAPAVNKEIGEFVVERVKFQARTESPFNQDGSFPQLKPATIKNREYLAKHNPTQATFEAGRANVTLTGKFLDSLMYLVKGPGQVVIFFEGMHPGYKTKTGQTKPVENKKLAKWLAEKGFAVFDRSINDNLIIKRRIKSIALAFVRRGLKVRNRLD